MDDLISRKDLLNNMRAGCIPLDEPEISGLVGDRETIRSYIVNAPSVPAVPLDKLCEWLNTVIYPCIICKESPGPQCNAKREGCWERELKKWMEGLDATN